MELRTSWLTVFSGLILCGLLAAGCSKRQDEASPPTAAPASPGQSLQTAPAAPAAPEAPQPASAPLATHPDPTDDPAFMKLVRTPWKGDLDAMAQRRLVRVLVPFRRPEYFFMEGQPAGVLVEAFREFETVLNARFKTTPANRIVVTLLPTPSHKVRDMLATGLADIAAGSISVTERNKAVADFSVPTATGLKILVVTGPGAPELKSVEDLSGQPVWVNPAMRTKDDLDALNARLKAAGKAPALEKEADAALASPPTTRGPPRSGSSARKPQRWATTRTSGSATSRSRSRNAWGGRRRSTWRTSTSTTWPTGWPASCSSSEARPRRRRRRQRPGRTPVRSPRRSPARRGASTSWPRAAAPRERSPRAAPHGGPQTKTARSGGVYPAQNVNTSRHTCANTAASKPDSDRSRSYAW
jgi:ABC-type amino acid transport substrate-binding protein